MKEKGFTLVELLAVIVILAIILAIAIPSITGIVDSQRKNAFESHIKMIIKNVEYKLLDDTEEFNAATVKVSDLGGDDDQFVADKFSVTIEEDGSIKVTAIAAKGKKFSGCCVTDATFNEVDVKDANYPASGDATCPN